MSRVKALNRVKESNYLLMKRTRQREGAESLESLAHLFSTRILSFSILSPSG